MLRHYTHDSAFYALLITILSQRLCASERFDVITNLLVKSTVRRSPSVKRPSSKTCNNI